MKMKLAAVSLLTLALSSAAFARHVSVPFIHLAVPAEGLSIAYSMAGQHPQKVSCVYENFLKGYLTITQNNVEKDAGVVFGNGDSGDQFNFSNQGQRWERTQGIDKLDQFQVDANGSITVKNSSYSSTPAYATCFYVPEDTK